jgi:hypothetical protein
MAALVETLKRMLDSEKLIIQTEQQIVIVPWASVQYVEASPILAAALPIGAIKGARINQGDRTRQP